MEGGINETNSLNTCETFSDSVFFHSLMDLEFNLINSINILSRKEIKVLTYNIFLRPPPVKNNFSDYKDARLKDFSKLLNNFDVICLQEMFGTFTSRRQQLIESAFHSGMFYHAEVPAPSFFSKNLIDPGLLILSRFPIVESEFKPFKNTVLQCSVVWKGILYAKIKIKDSNLLILNLHLQATYFSTNSDQWDLLIETRLSQIEELKKFISHIISEKNITPNDQIILLGDFNIDAHCFKHKINLTFDRKILNEYNILLEKLNELFITNDLIKNKFNSYPFTYGVTGEENLNKLDNSEEQKAPIEYIQNRPNKNSKYDLVLTDESDRGCFQSLDYIFEINPKSRETSKKLKIDYNSLKIEEFLIDDRPYQQLSDHFGISLDLVFEENSS